MNAIELLRTMHADAKVQFKQVLGASDPAVAGQAWNALKPQLELHEQLEEQFLYAPLQAEMGQGTPLGDWQARHHHDVEQVQELVATTSQLEPATSAWRMCVGKIQDALQKHITDEEGQIFPRIQQAWGADRLQQAGQQMQALVDTASSTRPAAATPPTPSKAAPSRTVASAAPARKRG